MQPYGIRILESAASETDLALIVSLRPEETISSCVSKLKGQVSKHLRINLELEEPTQLLSRGYFACTVGKSNTVQIERYLDAQAEHHGYDQRKRPPIFLEKYVLHADDEGRLAPNHSYVLAQFHVVLADRLWQPSAYLGSYGDFTSPQMRKYIERLRRDS